MTQPEQAVVFGLVGLGAEVIWTGARARGWGKSHIGYWLLYGSAAYILPLVHPLVSMLPLLIRMSVLAVPFALCDLGTRLWEGERGRKQLSKPLRWFPAWMLLAWLFERLWLALN